MILMRNQTAGNFGVCFGRKDRLAALFHITAPDAADIEGRTATIAFQRGISFFTEQLIHTDGRFIFRFIKWNLGDHLAFGRRNIFHIIVETGDCDAPVSICYIGHQLTQHIDRVGNRTTEMPGMQIAVRTCDLDLPIGKPTKSGCQGWRFGTDHAGIGNQDHIRFQQFFMCTAEGFEARRTDLFFSLEDKLHITFQQIQIQGCLETFYLHHGLPFIIIRTTRPDTAIPDFGFERATLPQVKRLGGHYVIVRIDQNGLRLRRNHLFPIHNRVAFGLHHNRFIGTGCKQEFCPAFCTSLHIRLMFMFGTYRWNTDQREKLFDETVFIGLDIFFYGYHIYS